jgi:hypothetical protein
VKKILPTLALVVAAVTAMAPVSTFYFETGKGQRCTNCHEMQPLYDPWIASSHRQIGCSKCHGSALTLDASFHLNNARRAWNHLRGEIPEEISFGQKEAGAAVEACAACHRQEFASWKAGPHSATYSRIFLDRKYNGANLLIDDCLRCHGMHYQGGIRDLVTPIDRSGPWRLVSSGMAETPSMPCLTCHQIHREGPLLQKTDESGRVAGPKQEIVPPSLAFFDRRTRQHVPIADLPLPAMMESDRPVKMSRDQRQALCYQCHAPIATMQVASGDDRTALGVHEGISCLACHARHGEQTRASCAGCHPKMSNCGLDVETMDTTFRSADSKHNVHWVKCLDCHVKGVPRKKPATVAAAVAVPQG